MPELPEVETVKETLKLRVLNEVIEDIQIYYEGIIENVSPTEFVNTLKNKQIKNIERRGKWLIFDLDEYLLLSHLRMEGRYYLKTDEDPILKHEHVVFKFQSQKELRYCDTRKFGRMHLLKKEDAYLTKPLNELGFEPWDNNLTPSYLKEKLKNKKIPIKTCLLDQSIMVGAGNIYVNEILFRSHIHPEKRADYLTLIELEKIIQNTRITLEKAIEKGGTTIRTYESSEGVHGRFQNELLVHGKEFCPNCEGKIDKIVVGGRGTYYCPKCQGMN